MMETWQEIRRWRSAMRADLLTRRLAVPHRQKLSAASIIRDIIATQFPELRHACIGFYWPFKGEIDPRRLVQDFLSRGATAALPAVVGAGQPLEFWAWRSGTTLRRGLWNSPVPGTPAPVRPTVLLIPLLGFDRAGYRLGHGGGFYDRTLASLQPRPLTIGVGYELGALETIHPQAHDIALDAIVTEAGFTRCGHNGQPFDAVIDALPPTVGRSGSGIRSVYQ